MYSGQAGGVKILLVGTTTASIITYFKPNIGCYLIPNFFKSSNEEQLILYKY